ncbi:protein phosphatase CheZ [Catenovulum maritimum]|uniref:Protein phosphatase CheZ n=1 Tax=Catenovulum maritimum TaxID=1513271 RepID=A0A0J8GRT7_9ALTE|nr:protein phosphatase CheZ [Catenovulum maritimum]KMT65505.1 protein phosphatase [Catenovulum maritimum]
MLPNAPQISLEDAKRLVTCLEQGDNDTANQIIEQATQAASAELFAEVGKLTRQLHDSLSGFQIDERLSNLATEDIPDAKNRLAYVMDLTEQSANKTMDAVEGSLPLAEDLSRNIKEIIPTWDKLMNRQIDLSEFKALCHSVDKLLRQAEVDSETLKSQMTEVLMAQDFQDLTGQVIRRVIDLVKEVEDSLIHLLTVFGEPQKSANDSDTQQQEVTSRQTAPGPEGPIIDAEEREDAVASQDEVDDLLSSLGF